MKEFILEISVLEGPLYISQFEVAVESVFFLLGSKKKKKICKVLTTLFPFCCEQILDLRVVYIKFSPRVSTNLSICPQYLSAKQLESLAPCSHRDREGTLEELLIPQAFSQSSFR